MAQKEYDFVIIGGGTSGVVVAARLSEDPGVQVLVLEAGEDYTEDPRVKIPALFEALKHTDADWDFKTEPQHGLKGRTIELAQGRCLGGSSAINAQVFVPPSKDVIDAWEDLGNPGWNWKSLEPYYAKTYSLPSSTRALKEHLGIGWTQKEDVGAGPLQTSYTGNLDEPLSKAWIDTFKNVGYHMADDPFSGAQCGAFSSLSTTDAVTKERSYAVSAYLAPTANRKNLHVITNSEVEKILLSFDGTEQKATATGVQFHQNGEVLTVKATKEVILAAGTIQSPAILEHSGIGSSQLLKSLGIHPLIDNEYVGENLQDHIICAITLEAQDHVETLDDLIRQDPEAIQAAMTEYMTSKSGPLASVGVSSYAYLPITDFLSEKGQKELNRLFQANTAESLHPAAQEYQKILKAILEDKNDGIAPFLFFPGQNVMDIDPEWPGSPVGASPGKFISVGTMLAQPLSRGNVHITTSTSSTAPKIDPKYFSHPLDLEIYALQMRYLSTITTTAPFSNFLKEEGKGPRRDPKSDFGEDLEAVKEYVRTSGYSMWHPIGTCSMLPREKGGVVDERLVVWGTGKLRVVDASVMPLIPRGNVQSSVYAVAERAADIIRGEYELGR